ncbi:Translocation protein S66 [Rhizina undulata]
MAKLSILAPLIYIAVLVGALAVFSSLYRKRKAIKAASLEPWFGPHNSRDIYMNLLHLEASPRVPDSILKAALLRRAIEDIQRIFAIRQAKGALQQLLTRGSIGDELWTRFTAAEAEMEAVNPPSPTNPYRPPKRKKQALKNLQEIRDVVIEANAFKEGWGQIIFQQANEMANAQRIHDRANEIPAQAAAERAWWDKKRERTSRELLGEGNSDEDGVLVEQPSPVKAGSASSGSPPGSPSAGKE